MTRDNLLQASVLMICVLWMSFPFSLFAQTVRFHIEDVETSQPISGAVVRAVEKGGRTLRYGLTDQDGIAEIAVPQETDTLTVSLLGYGKQSFFRPFLDQYHVSLKTAELRIQPSGVTAYKVEEVGDTIRYSIAALRVSEDLILSDVLKRLPGVEVTKSGYVKYNGQNINRFYVEGKDILESSYNLATQHLSVDAIQSVEILQNHQPIKMLEGIKDSDRAAMNIVLNEDARRKWTGRASAVAGAATASPTFPLAGELSAFYIAPGMSSVDVATYDGQGKALQEQDYTLQQDRSNRHVGLRGRIDLGGIPAPMEEKRSLFNQTFCASTVNRLSSKETTGLSVTVKYASDRKESSTERVSVYRKTVSEDRIFAWKEDRNVDVHRLSGALSYSDNGQNHYVQEIMHADLGLERGRAAIAGDWERNQDAGRKEWTMENDATIGAKMGEKVIQITSFTQWSGVEENLSLGIPGQRVQAFLFDQQIAFSNISKAKGPWRWTLRPEAEVTVYRHDYRLTNLHDEIPGLRNELSKSSLWQTGLVGGLSFNRAPFRSAVDASLHYASFRIGEATEGRGIGSVRMFIKYVAGRWECSLKTEAGVRAPNIQNVGETIVMTGYQSLWKGSETMFYVPYSSSSIEYIYRAPISGWHFRTSLGTDYTKGRASARNIYNGFILSYLTDDVYATRSENMKAEITKGLFSINGKAQVRMDYQHSTSVFRQDGKDVGYGLGALSTTGQLSMTLFRRWRILADVRATRYRFLPVDGESVVDVSFMSGFGNTLFFSDAWSGNLKVDIHYDSGIDKAFLFPDIGLVWKGRKGLRVRVEALNLLDRQEYAYVQLSPLLEESYKLKIRPLTVLIGVDWRF